MANYTIEVRSKKEMPDISGLETARGIEDIGIACLESVSVAWLYRFGGDVCPSMLREIAEQVLIDPVIQEYEIYPDSPCKDGFWTVEVWFRKGVTDTVAATAAEAARDMGIGASFSVSTGRKYYLSGQIGAGDVDSIARKVLANELIHDFTISDFTGQIKK